MLYIFLIYNMLFKTKLNIKHSINHQTEQLQVLPEVSQWCNSKPVLRGIEVLKLYNCIKTNDLVFFEITKAYKLGPGYTKPFCFVV